MPTISKDAPDIPVDQVIQNSVRANWNSRKSATTTTYTQTFVIQTIDYDNRPDGEYRMTSDILFTPEGKRYEKVDFGSHAEFAAHQFVTAGPGRWSMCSRLY